MKGGELTRVLGLRSARGRSTATGRYGLARRRWKQLRPVEVRSRMSSVSLRAVIADADVGQAGVIDGSLNPMLVPLGAGAVLAVGVRDGVKGSVARISVAEVHRSLFGPHRGRAVASAIASIAAAIQRADPAARRRTLAVESCLGVSPLPEARCIPSSPARVSTRSVVPVMRTNSRTPEQPVLLAGWHPDPESGERLRWWDGRCWTEHVHERATP